LQLKIRALNDAAPAPSSEKAVGSSITKVVGIELLAVFEFADGGAGSHSSIRRMAPRLPKTMAVI